MAQWKTHHKRARQVKARQDRTFAELMQWLESDKPSPVAIQFGQLFSEPCVKAMATAFSALAESMAKAIEQISVELKRLGWQPLEPRYARALAIQNSWPDVIYEDVLDAEFIDA